MNDRSIRAFVMALTLFGMPAGASARATDTLTVVTLNLWHDQHDWPRRLNVILAEMRRIRPDVLCLQEVLQNPNLRNQAETLGDSLGCHVQFASVDGPERPKRYGNAILTPHPVLVGESRNLAPIDDYRAVAHVRFDWRGRTIDAYSTHLHHTPEGGSIRATQIRHLLAYVDSTRGDGPYGDRGRLQRRAGNARNEPGHGRITRRVPRRASEGESRPRRRRSTHASVSTRARSITSSSSAMRRLALTPVACDVIFRTVGPDSVWASDHFGRRREASCGEVSGVAVKAIVCHRYGAPEALRLEDVDKPTPGDGEVLIQVRAASLNASTGASHEGPACDRSIVPWPAQAQGDDPVATWPDASSPWAGA